MMRVVKVNTNKRNAPIYFIDGFRCDLNDDMSVLQEVLGDEFQEYWLTSRANPDYLSYVGVLEELEELIEANPEMVMGDV